MIKDVNVYKVQAISNRIRLYWDKPNGEYGEYDLILADDVYSQEQDNMQQQIFGYSEYMDSKDDKQFLESLLKSLVSHVEVVR